jgi:glycine/D-amino acid oxidase-like deaminating enzyme
VQVFIFIIKNLTTIIKQIEMTKIEIDNSAKNIAVIGAGIIGINCALELQSLGFQVTLIDKAGIGEGCSKANAGHFATEQVFPLAEPSLLWAFPKLLLDPLGPVSLSASYLPKALPWFGQFIMNMLASKRAKNSMALKTLNKNAINYYQPLLKEAKAQALLSLKGSLLVFEKSSDKTIERQFMHYKNAGVDVLLLDRQQTLLLEPNLSQNIKASLYFTKVGHSIDPFAICTTLAELAFQKGCEFHQAEVVHISHNKVGANLTTLNETLQFDHIVIASGAWSKKLIEPLGYNLPIEAERGYSLDLPPCKKEHQLTRPVASAERKFIMTPMRHGLRLAGTVEYAGLNKSANMKRADMLFRNAQHVLNVLPEYKPADANPSQKWMGHRPTMPDSLPVICQTPKHENIYLALGHQHLGLTQGAITGKIIGQLISKKATDIDINPFCIGRFN